MPSRSYSPRPRGPDNARGSGVLLDPYGIYGTRTANRMRATRRRRQTQNVLLLLLVMGVLAGGVAFVKLHRVAAVKSSGQSDLLSPVVVPPVLASDDESNREAILLATADGRLLRLDRPFPQDKAPQVVLDTAFPLHAPLVNNGVAFVPCEDGVLYATDWQHSKVLWHYDFHAPLTARPAQTRIEIQSAPQAVVAAPGSLAAVAPASPSSAPTKSAREVIIAGADNGLLVALDAGKGKPVWKTQLPAPVGDAIVVTEESAPRVLVPVLGGATTRGGLWCLDAASGKVLWRFPKGGREEAMQLAPPVADEESNRVFFAGETGAILSLDLKRGVHDEKKKIGWKTFTPALQKKSATAILWRVAPLLFFGGERETGSTRLVTGASDGSVRCLSAGSGDLLWQFVADAPVAGLQKARWQDRDTVLVCTRGASLFLIDAITGTALRRFSGQGLLTGAAVAGDEIVAVTTEGVVQYFPL